MYKRKLTAEDAVEMRDQYATGNYTIGSLAELHGVAPTTAWRIIQGFSYKSETGGEPVKLPDGKHSYKRESFKGTEHPLHVLTEEEVMKIRWRIAKDGVRGQKIKLYNKLAQQFIVSPATIASISASHTWKHLPSVEQLKKVVAPNGLPYFSNHYKWLEVAHENN